MTVTSNFVDFSFCLIWTFICFFFILDCAVCHARKLNVCHDVVSKRIWNGQELLHSCTIWHYFRYFSFWFSLRFVHTDYFTILAIECVRWYCCFDYCTTTSISWIGSAKNDLFIKKNPSMDFFLAMTHTHMNFWCLNRILSVFLYTCLFYFYFII